MIEILVDGRNAREVDLGCPKCSDPDLAEIYTIVMVFDDRNIGGRKGPWESLGRAFGVFGIAPGGPEEVPGWPMRPMGGAGQPMGHLDLRFPILLGPLTL